MCYWVFVKLYWLNVCCPEIMSHVWLGQLIGLNAYELNLYSFMIGLDNCNESCNAVNDLSSKICVPSKTKDVDVKVFNVIKK